MKSALKARSRVAAPNSKPTGKQSAPAAPVTALDDQFDGVSVLGLPTNGVDPLAAAMAAMGAGPSPSTSSSSPVSFTTPAPAPAAPSPTRGSKAGDTKGKTLNHPAAKKSAPGMSAKRSLPATPKVDAYRDMIAQLSTGNNNTSGAATTGAPASQNAPDAVKDNASESAKAATTPASNAAAQPKSQVSFLQQHQASAAHLRQHGDVARREALSHQLLFTGDQKTTFLRPPADFVPSPLDERQKRLREEAIAPQPVNTQKPKEYSDEPVIVKKARAEIDEDDDGADFDVERAADKLFSLNQPAGGNSGSTGDNAEDSDSDSDYGVRATEPATNGGAELSPALQAMSNALHPKIFRAIRDKLRVEQLTRIQQLSFAPIMKHTRDVIVRSETGSGKTLAYLLPLLTRLLKVADAGGEGQAASRLTRDDGTYILVLCPTRELTIQVEEVVGILTHYTRFLVTGSLHGGENRHKEKARLRKGLSLLVATPGRVLDHLQHTESFITKRLQSVVLDEADRLLDMGFERAIREIMASLEERAANYGRTAGGSQSQGGIQRILVSATITPAVERLSHFTLRQPVIRVAINHNKDGSAAANGQDESTVSGLPSPNVFFIPASLRQHVVSVPIKHRLSTLLGFLRSQLDAGARRIVVFVSTADSAEFHYRLLSRLKSPFYTKNKAIRPVVKSNSGAEQRNSGSAAPRNAHPDSSDEDDEDEDEDDTNSDEADKTAAEKPKGLSKSKEVGHGSGMSLDDPSAFFAVNIFKLHGNMAQVDRASVFHAFKYGIRGKAKTPKTYGAKETAASEASLTAARNNEKGVLFCTDVVARGLDMPAIDWIVHYDPPTEVASYIHRIGRTARIGNAGDSLLFLSPHEIKYAEYLAKQTRQYNETPASSTEQPGGSTRTQTGEVVMENRRFESFLFYLTKLDPSSQHQYKNSTANLEKAICHTVMRSLHSMNNNGKGYRYKNNRHGRGNEDGDAGDSDDEDMNEASPKGGQDDDSLARIALFAYQSYLRSYAGLPRELKHQFFAYDQLHLGHIAHSFGIDRTPHELQNLLRGTIKEDHELSRKALFQRRNSDRPSGIVGINDRGGRHMVENAPYRSAVVQKQVKSMRDYREQQRQDGTLKPVYRANQFSEFDA